MRLAIAAMLVVSHWVRVGGRASWSWTYTSAQHFALISPPFERNVGVPSGAAIALARVLVLCAERGKLLAWEENAQGDDATGEGNLCSQTSIDCWAKIPAIAPCEDAWVTEGKKGVVRSPAA